MCGRSSASIMLRSWSRSNTTKDVFRCICTILLTECDKCNTRREPFQLHSQQINLTLQNQSFTLIEKKNLRVNSRITQYSIYNEFYTTFSCIIIMITWKPYEPQLFCSSYAFSGPQRALFSWAQIEKQARHSFTLQVNYVTNMKITFGSLCQEKKSLAQKY